MAEHEHRSDEQLIDACNAGDAAAFAELYRRYRDWGVRVAYRYTRDRSEALDVMQEAFSYLLSRFPGFRLQARLTSFLYVVIKHNALSGRRKLRRERLAGESADVPAGTPAPDPDRYAALSRAVARLPDAQREVLLMRFVDQMALADIAAALAVPLGTVKSRLHHAIAALRDDPGTAGYFAGP